jgi:two-component system KDP operon response regulator KdpE
MSLRVLLIEDDPALRALLADSLRVEGYTVQAAASLADARALWQEALRQQQGFEILLLDLGLPDGDGESLLSECRRDCPSTPVLVLSARDQELGKIRLLDEGADDYLVKPFTVGELQARMRVALRHRGRPQQAAITRYQHGDITVDVQRHRVCRAGQEVHLTPTEFSLLARLVRQAGRVVTHRQLLADVWGPEHVDQTHYLRLYMAQLRAKLELDSTRPAHLLTEPGVDYRLAEGDAE